MLQFRLKMTYLLSFSLRYDDVSPTKVEFDKKKVLKPLNFHIVHLFLLTFATFVTTIFILCVVLLIIVCCSCILDTFLVLTLLLCFSHFIV